MRDLPALQDVLDRAQIDPSVCALRPDYRALLLAVDGVHEPATTIFDVLTSRFTCARRGLICEQTTSVNPPALFHATLREGSGALRDIHMRFPCLCSNNHPPVRTRFGRADRSRPAR